MAEANTQGKRRKLAPRSDVWQHFTRFTDEQGKKKARCKRCSEILSAEHGTTSLKKHVTRTCRLLQGGAAGPPPPPPPPPLQPPPCAPSHPAESSHHEGGLDGEEASRDLAWMIALHGYNPSVVEADDFRSFVRRLKPEFQVPSPRAIEKMCSDVFQAYMKNVSRSREEAPGRLSVAVGYVNIIGAGRVLYTACQFIDDEWNLGKEILGARVVLPYGEHYHAPLFGVPVVSQDNAVESALSTTPRTYDQFIIVGEKESMCEIKNHLRKEKEIWKSETFLTTYMDRLLDSIAQCLLPNPDFAKAIFSDIKDLPVKSIGERRELVRQCGLPDDPWEYDERWCSCYCSLEILGQMIPGTESESRKLLRSLWGEIYHAIRRVSDSSRPTSNLCLQQLFKVRGALQSQKSEAIAAHAGKYSGFDQSVADILIEAIYKADTAIEESYLVWSIPLVLDPRYKLEFCLSTFKSAYDVLASNYTSEVEKKIKELHSDDYYQGHEEELDDYLKNCVISQTEDFDILNWWKENSGKYPKVALLARDALAMPTSSKLSSHQIAHIRSMLRYSKI